MSLSDKMRDEKRNMYTNLKLLIIDEISLVDSDMLYKIDLRIREISHRWVYHWEMLQFSFLVI